MGFQSIAPKISAPCFKRFALGRLCDPHQAVLEMGCLRAPLLSGLSGPLQLGLNPRNQRVASPDSWWYAGDFLYPDFFDLQDMKRDRERRRARREAMKGGTSVSSVAPSVVSGTTRVSVHSARALARSGARSRSKVPLCPAILAPSLASHRRAFNRPKISQFLSDP